MTKVYPNATVKAEINSAITTVTTSNSAASDGNAAVLTVWKKSLLFNCNGFTVYDGKGDLIFRVDNYMQGSKGEIVLMDAAGKPLLTIRRKRLCLGDNWFVYYGEGNINPRFSVQKHVHIRNHKCLAHVSSTNTCSDHETAAASNKKNAMYEIEGSYTQRSCAVYDGKKRCVAEVKKKESVGGVAFGVDVFRLIVQPEIDTADAMALVILLDQMFEPSRRISS